MGRLIPAGTGMEHYRDFRLLTEEQQPEEETLPQPFEEPSAEELVKEERQQA